MSHFPYCVELSSRGSEHDLGPWLRGRTLRGPVLAMMPPPGCQISLNSTLDARSGAATPLQVRS